jgi:ribosomal protein L30E
MPFHSQEFLANVNVKKYIIMTEFLNPLAVKMHPIALLSIVDHHERAVGQRT